MSPSSNQARNAQILWTLGLLRPDELPEIATKALVAGLDTPSLRSLAGSDNEDSPTLNKLFEEVLSELGLARMTCADAARRYAAMVSGQILRGEVSEINGARLIVGAGRTVAEENFHDLDPFVYCESEYDDPDRREFFDRQIREEASRWVDRF